jgi:hypothetical protein
MGGVRIAPGSRDQMESVVLPPQPRREATCNEQLSPKLETMPEELFEDVKQAVDAYEREGDET